MARPHPHLDYKFYQFWLNVLSDEDAEKYIKIFTELDEATLLDVFDGAPTFEVERADIEAGIRHWVTC